MSTTWYYREGLSFTRFCGGDRRGTCVQITVPVDHTYNAKGYVQLTKAQAREAIAQLTAFVNDDEATFNPQGEQS